MTATEILERLQRYNGEFPKEAVQAAIKQRETIVPLLLEALEAAAQDPSSIFDYQDRELIHYSMFLLAQFRETRALRPLCQFLSADPIKLDAYLGQTITEYLHRILANLIDLDVEPIQKLIENPDVEPWVRGAALESLAVLVRQGRLDREVVQEYIHILMSGRLPRESHPLWYALMIVVLELRFSEFAWSLMQAVSDGRVDSWFDPSEDLERLRNEESSNESWLYWQTIEDTVAEMSWWSAFNPELGDSDEAWNEGEIQPISVLERWLSRLDLESVPHVRSADKIGRNDPCPCGSGKKAKKCCHP